MKKLLLIIIIVTNGILGFSQMNFYCDRPKPDNDSMQRAWYPYQIIDSIVFKENTDFIIANDSNKPTIFVSSEEEIYKSLALKEPNSLEYFNKFGKDYYEDYYQYLINFYTNRIEYVRSAIEENHYANSMDMVVWIQNRTKDTIMFPTQDGSLIGILEAKNGEGIWKPIQFWWLSWCGNSYMRQILPQNHSIQIGLNNMIGDIKTLMRLKIHGMDTVYISNEFPGTVSNNSFILDEETKNEMNKDIYRITFLDSIHHGLADEVEYEFSGFTEE